jgi:hypothetical protein
MRAGGGAGGGGAPPPPPPPPPARRGADLRTRRARRPRDRLGHAAHAALDPPPGAEVAVDLPHPVMHQHVRRPRCHRAAPRADHRLRGQRSLHPRILEPLVEQVGGAHREQPNQLVDVPAGPPAEPRARSRPAEDVGQPHVRRHGEQQPSQQPADVLEGAIERHVGLGVVLVESRDVLHVAAQVAPERERRSVGERDEVIGRDDRDPVAESLQIQLGDDPLRQQRHHVCSRGDPVAVPHRLGDGRTAKDVSTLEDEDVASGFGEVRGARETVVPAPHHDHVTLGRAHGRGG